MLPLAIAEFLNKNVDSPFRVSMFSLLSHPANDVRVAFCYADFNGRYIRLAGKYPDGAAVVAKYKKQLQQIAAGNIGVIRQTKFPTEEMGMLVVARNPSYIRKIPQTLKMRLAAIKKSPEVISLLDKPKSIEILTAIRLNGYLIKHFPNKEKYYMDAVKQTPDTLRYMKRQSDELIWAAILAQPNAIQFVEMPTVEMAEYAMKLGVPVRDIKNRTEAFFYSAMKHNKANFKEFLRSYFNPRMKEFVVEFYPEFILYLPNPPLDKVIERVKMGDLFPRNNNVYTEEIYYEYILKHPDRLRDCRVKSNRIIKEALKHDQSQFIEVDQDQKVCDFIAEEFPELFGRFRAEFQSAKLCRKMLDLDYRNMLAIHSPTQYNVDYAIGCRPDKKREIERYAARDEHGRPVYDVNGNRLIYPFDFMNVKFTLISDGALNLRYTF